MRLTLETVLVTDQVRVMKHFRGVHFEAGDPEACKGSEPAVLNTKTGAYRTVLNSIPTTSALRSSPEFS